MTPNVVSLTQQFVRIPSHADNKIALAKILTLALSHLQGYTIERFERNGVKSALIYNTKKRPKKLRLILNGHLDVIPGKVHQYRPRREGNRLYGVGVMDMKANVACLVKVFTEVARRVSYPIALQLVTDEEVGGFHGTKYQIENEVRADFVLAGEPTNFDIVNRAKGIVWLNISAPGKAAHGAYPWKGDNAVWKMHAFLTALKKRYPIPTQDRWVTTVNVSTIGTTNQSYNKIPDDCVVGLDIRCIPEDCNIIMKRIKQLLPKGFHLEILAHEPPLQTDGHHSDVQLLRKTAQQVMKKKIILRGAHGSSDARHFSQAHCPGIEFGPIGGGIGSDDEWVSIPSLEQYQRVLRQFLFLLE